MIVMLPTARTTPVFPVLRGPPSLLPDVQAVPDPFVNPCVRSVSWWVPQERLDAESGVVPG